MTSQGNGQPVLYEVKLSEQLENTIKQLHQQVAQQGEGSSSLMRFAAFTSGFGRIPMDLGNHSFIYLH